MKNKISLRDLNVKSFTTSKFAQINIKGGTNFTGFATNLCTACGNQQCGA
ncbi:MAG: hypothetical protein WBB45_09615 [Cyclobacteriaceae bacterium]